MATANSTSPTLTRLDLSGWRQFEDVVIEFHPRLTILTGQNGAGKTTILNLIAPHFGWSIPMATVPNIVDRVFAYVTGIWRRFFGTTTDREGEVVARLTYSNGQTADILVPASTAKSSTYRITYLREQPLQGLYIPSHRPLFLPSDLHVEASASQWERQAAFDAYVERFRPQWTGSMPQYLGGMESATPLTLLKQVLIDLPEGNAEEDEEFTFKAFEAKLSKVLPASIRFKNLERRGTEIMLITSTGEFSMDAVSGGIAAVIDMSWQIFLYPNVGPFIVLIDEPENHLHPEMQRTILPQLLEAFPQAQFIVATHAPMVVTSMRDCTVYALIYGEALEPSKEQLEPTIESMASLDDPRITGPMRVHAFEQEDFARAGTADDTLRRILGLDYTMPQWAAEKLHESAMIIVDKNASEEALVEVKADLVASGLGEYMSETLTLASEELKTRPEMA